MANGRTKPAIVACETDAGDVVDVVAKFSANCDQGVTNLAREVIAACLAGDLGLPVPEPFLIDISPAWAASVSHIAYRTAIQNSAPVAFASKLVGPQFSAWNDGTALRPAMLPMALGTFVFDAIIQNPDRRAGNPNCLVRGEKFHIFDHELAFFPTHLLIGGQPPWKPGALQALVTPGFHIFRKGLRGVILDFTPVRDSWMRLTDSQIDDYVHAIPPEWNAAVADVNSAIALIKGARDRIDACISEIQRVLT